MAPVVSYVGKLTKKIFNSPIDYSLSSRFL